MGRDTRKHVCSRNPDAQLRVLRSGTSRDAYVRDLEDIQACWDTFHLGNLVGLRGGSAVIGCRLC